MFWLISGKVVEIRLAVSYISCIAPVQNERIKLQVPKVSWLVKCIWSKGGSRGWWGHKLGFEHAYTDQLTQAVLTTNTEMSNLDMRLKHVHTIFHVLWM